MKKLMSLVLVFVMLAGVIPFSANAAGGNGTESNPYIIENETELALIASGGYTNNWFYSQSH